MNTRSCCVERHLALLPLNDDSKELIDLYQQAVINFLLYLLAREEKENHWVHNLRMRQFQTSCAHSLPQHTMAPTAHCQIAPLGLQAICTDKKWACSRKMPFRCRVGKLLLRMHEWCVMVFRPCKGELDRQRKHCSSIWLINSTIFQKLYHDLLLI